MENRKYTCYIVGEGNLAKACAEILLSDKKWSLLGLVSPNKDIDIKGHILILPAFAEEMNKTRHSMTLLAIEAARAGYGVLMIDVFGTGDSQGDFADANWENWLDDVNKAYEWIVDKGASSIIVLGIRLGCLLSLTSAKYLADVSEKSAFAILSADPGIPSKSSLNPKSLLRTIFISAIPNPPRAMLLHDLMSPAECD